MNTIANDALAVAKELDPNAPLVQAADAVLETAANPSVSNIVSDIMLVEKLVAEIKAKLVGVHPSALAYLKALL